MSNENKKQQLRLPGQSLDEKLQDFLVEKIWYHFAIIVFVFSVVSSEWLRLYWKTTPRPIFVSILGGMAIFYSFFLILKNLKEAQKIKKGRDGERVVGQHLEELRADGSIIFHDILGPDFNIDHVIVSPHGIFTVETKNWSRRDKNETIIFDGTQIIVNGKPPDRDPITQSFAQSNWLKNILKESTGKEFVVNPVIVFPDWFVEPETTHQLQEKGVLVLNPKALPSFIKNKSEVLNNEDLHLVAYHLTRYIKTLRPVDLN